MKRKKLKKERKTEKKSEDQLSERGSPSFDK